MFRLINFIIIGVCFTHFAYGGFENHLKVAENKQDYHKMRSIDFIYMINLDQRPEKWELSQNQLNPFGIYPYRFSAVNGWQQSLEAINDIGLKFKHGMESGFMATSYKMDGNFEPSV